MTLPQGKIPIKLLKDIVFKNLGAKRDEVVLGPSPGIDGAAIRIGNKFLIVSMDPITGALERIGWLAVNVNANDVATFGCEPLFFASCILLPEKSGKRILEKISKQMNDAARDLGIAIVGGHCETKPGLKDPIVIGCMMGLTENGKCVTAGGAKPKDHLILTKSAGIEGTAILATDKQNLLRESLSAKTLRTAKEFYKQMSIVKEATTAFKTGKVHAMHDPTEGGVAGAIHEMADASNLGFHIYEKRIRVRPQTQRICRFFGIDPLRLIASGSLLIAVKPDSTEQIKKALAKEGISSETIGEFTSSPEDRKITRRSNRTENLERPRTDDLWQALAR
jgi:hydrogenase maturation factor